MSFEISRLALDHFRSWTQVVLDFSSGINILVGKNGIGKTNIVEAIEFLSSGSSHRVNASKYLIERGYTKATVRANVVRREKTVEGKSRTFEVTIPIRGAVRSRIDSGSSQYFRDIAGQVKTVIFSPRDQQLINGDPAARRGFLDSSATMMFPDYYSALQHFRHVAKQRTAVLKHLADLGPASSTDSAVYSMTLTELEVWTSQFIDAGITITQYRKKVVELLTGFFTQIYSNLSDNHGIASLQYEPSFAEVLDDSKNQNISRIDDGSALNGDQEVKSLIAQHFQRIYPGEVARGSNLIGPHRDDLLISIDGEPAKEFASNGELWTLGLALKMAQFEYLSQEETPLLILDDVFAQLDESRRAQILDFASRQSQVFITVAARSDIPDVDATNLIDVEEIASKAHENSAENMLARLGFKASEA